ncbi:EF-hand domain-containing protein [Sphingomonas montanisoli]|uniref:EF-hand domain-containing protein n=1 Tax=Sphingomonas montanisoli TaxID=2606412 RepID=UPI0015E16267|nr:EF-hand domain-containing protein [Sphingomonas montanisoli]
MRIALALLAAALSTAAVAKKADPAVCPGPIPTQLFMSPVGEPFRPQPDGGDPVTRWFDGADRNHDGQLTQSELILDADRFFATLDKDHNGELLPDEISDYEENVAPEVKLYRARQAGAPPAERPSAEAVREARERAKRRAKGDGGYDGPMGAGRYAFVNVPNPVAGADADLNRAIDRDEFRRMAADRFRELDPNLTKMLTLATLPRTPAQIEANRRCIEKLKEKASGRAPQKRKEPSP